MADPSIKLCSEPRTNPANAWISNPSEALWRWLGMLLAQRSLATLTSVHQPRFNPAQITAIALRSVS